MNRWWLVLVLLLSLGVNLGVVGILIFDQARPKRREPPPPQEMAELGGGGDLIARLPRFANYLGLEGKGRQEFLDIQVSLFQETTRLRLRLAEIHRDLRRELTGESPDPARADRLLHDAAGVYLQMEKAFTDSVLASRKLLDGSQEQRYIEVLTRLRAAARGQLGQAPGGEDGGVPLRGLGADGQEGRPPLGGRQGGPGFRQPLGGDPRRQNGALRPNWQNRPFQQQRLQRLEWRRMQRERPFEGQGRPPKPAPPPPSPPPPVY